MLPMEPIDEEQKNIIWKKWKSGIPVNDIGRALGRPTSTIFSYLKYHGGIRPRQRFRRASSLSFEEREEISRGLATNLSIRTIALSLGRSPSTISREINRNRGIANYRAADAHRAAWVRASRPKICILVSNSKLRELVTCKLKDDWSPEQISGWLKLEYPNDEGLRVSHETIYKSLFVQTRGLFRKELRKHLRTKRNFRRSRSFKATTRGGIADGVSISERPAIVEDRAIPGHWEGDLIHGSKNTFIATVVERQTRFTVLVKVDGKDTQSVVTALSEQMVKLPKLLKQSLTWDRGNEMAGHVAFSVATKMDVYFCDPRSPWQRGTNENTNGLLRQYFPKGTSLSRFTQDELNRAAAKLNNRPRKTLGFYTPAQKLDEVLR